jgi:hypothetical protein
MDALDKELAGYDTAARLAVEGRKSALDTMARYPKVMAALRESELSEKRIQTSDNDNLRPVADAMGRKPAPGVDLYDEWPPARPQARRGDWMQLYSGKQFWPMDPRAEEIEIEDIAHSLSMQCRYAGHCVRFYSVAEHSVLLARYFLDKGNPEVALYALLHDASEAFLVDVPRPIKPFLPGYKEAEARVMAAVCDRFGLPHEMPPEVHGADSAIIGNERENMRPCVAEWHTAGAPLAGVELFYWTPEKAEAAFLSAFREIQRARQQQRRVAA